MMRYLNIKTAKMGERNKFLKFQILEFQIHYIFKDFQKKESLLARPLSNFGLSDFLSSNNQNTL